MVLLMLLRLKVSAHYTQFALVLKVGPGVNRANITHTYIHEFS